MFWPTGILYPVRPRRFLLRRPSPRPIRLTRRTSIVLMLFLVCVILFLSRILGENARNSPNQRRIRLKKLEMENWKATHDAYLQLARQAQAARGRKAWLLRKRIADLGKGIWSKSTEEEVSKGCPTIPAQEHVPVATPTLPPSPKQYLHDAELESAELYSSPPSETPLGKHVYGPNGLLEVNPAGPHPIYELVKRSEEEWNIKHRKASKTLREAVLEYKRRYKRLPPTGFDIWWDYVQKHQVPLPDEYDQIHEDLGRYWAVNPVDLQATQTAQEAHKDTFTIGKTTWSSPLSVLNFSFNGEAGLMADHFDRSQSGSYHISERSDLPSSFFTSPNAHTNNQHLNGAFNIFEMLADVQAHIPPFRAVFSPHDNPSMLRDWGRRQEALTAIKTGRTVNVKAIEEGPPNLLGWRAACPPDSPARRQVDLTDWDAPDVFSTLPHPVPSHEVTNKTFVYSHDASMDPCQHPSHFIIHGQFISHRKGPVPERRGGGFIPMFSYSPTRVHDDIVVAVGEGSQHSSSASSSFSRRMEAGDEDLDLGMGGVDDEDDFGMDVDIEELLKLPLNELERVLDLDTDSRLLWRGSNTGMWHAPRRGWERSQRSRLVFWAGGGEGVVARDVGDDAERDVQNELGEHVDVKTARAFGAGMGGMLGVLIPPPNTHPIGEASSSSLDGLNSLSISSGKTTRRSVGTPAQVKKSLWAPSMLDVAFTAAGSDDGGVGPLNCEGTTCEKLRKVFEWRRRMEMKEAGQYRFVMDVDGNAWSSRFRKLLAGPSPSTTPADATADKVLDSKTVKQKRWDQHLRRRRADDPPASLVFKSTIYKEWWADRAQAWVHYVPVQLGLEDLWDALVFFRGKLGEEVDDLVMELRQHRMEEDNKRQVEADKERTLKSDDERKRAEDIYKRKTRALEMKLRDSLERHLMGRRIARRGREWSARYWRKEDMVAYMFRQGILLCLRRGTDKPFFRLFLEYARVMSPNRDQMFFDPDDILAGVKEPSRAKVHPGAAQQVLDLQAREESVGEAMVDASNVLTEHVDMEATEISAAESLDDEIDDTLPVDEEEEE
ncbi:hypothetical protein CVT24_011497 [Panaeolus cyanescens]|uniref:Glycosyl transferase CAP10 domain-containing protein n=1 Tax=Panaeolus cyanescens TaxID=181874 RepID=A0A409VGQ3_9AGAR|nr:hypothetical protein CVT24_011497 [Panaeolus cyanescens]